MSKQTELVTLEIDPDTLAFRADFSFAFVGDIYIVLKQLVSQFESGELANEMELQDEDGNQLNATKLRKHIQDIRFELEKCESSGLEDIPEYSGGSIKN